VNIAGKTVGIDAILAGLGGICAVVGAFLAWYTLSVKTSGTVSGVSINGEYSASAPSTSSGAAILAIVLGIVVLALVAAWVMRVKVPYLTAIIALVGVVILVVVALSYFTDILSVRFTTSVSGIFKSTGGSSGISVNPPSESVQKVFDEFNKNYDTLKAQVPAGASISGGSGFGIGLFLEVAAGILAIVGGGLALLKKSA
jgi:hypothetical protein